MAYATLALINLYQHRKRLAPLGASVSESRKTISEDRKDEQQFALFGNKPRQNQENRIRLFDRYKITHLHRGSLGTC